MPDPLPENATIHETRLSPAWLLAVAVAAGLLLGPAGLGRLSPDTYQRYFSGNVPHPAAVAQQLRAQAQQDIERLEATGVSASAVGELKAQLEGQSEARLSKARADYLQAIHAYHGKLQALVLALLAVMLFEAVTPLTSDALHARLRWLRWLIGSAWAAMLLIQPAAAAYLAWPWIAALAFAAVAILAVPVRRGSDTPRRREDREEDEGK